MAVDHSPIERLLAIIGGDNYFVRAIVPFLVPISNMPTRLLTRSRAVQPWRLFLFVLALVFAIEVGVMFLLPMILPASCPPQVAALVDACILTMILAPMLWVLVVRPLQLLAVHRSVLLTQLLSAQEDERRRLARDLHDGLGQYLTTLTIGLRTIEETPTLELVQTRARELRRIGGEAHEEIRRMVRGLRPAVLDDLGLAAALERHFLEMREAHGIVGRLQFNCPGEHRLPPRVETALYRIIQEATSNAVRHGEATQIDVKVDCDADKVELQVIDNGRGFDLEEVLRRPPAQGPFGLFGIRQRAEELRGEATVESSPGRGTTIRVRIPLKEVTHG